MKVVGYARTDWAEQVDGSHPSIAEQERSLRQFAEQTGLALDKVHTDSGLGPNQGTCAGLINILDSMEQEWDAVLITSACRLRGVANISFDPLEELAENRKRVLVADPATAKVLAEVVRKERAKRPPRKRATSEAERRKEIADRLLKGREAGAKAGKHQSGPAPFGYRRDYARRTTDGVLLVPDEKEADIVQLIFREYLRLRSMKRLIKLLDEMGLRTRRGKRWSRAGVSWILKNDTYVGRVHFGDIRVKGRHDSIVPPILFNKVQKLIRANNKRNRRGAEDTGKEQRAGSKPAKGAAKPKGTKAKPKDARRKRAAREHVSANA